MKKEFVLGEDIAWQHISECSHAHDAMHEDIDVGYLQMQSQPEKKFILSRSSR